MGEEKGLVMKYFILKPAGSSIFAFASRRAMQTYARTIQEYHPTLAGDLFKWADEEQMKPINRKEE